LGVPRSLRLLVSTPSRRHLFLLHQNAPATPHAGTFYAEFTTQKGATDTIFQTTTFHLLTGNYPIRVCLNMVYRLARGKKCSRLSFVYFLEYLCNLRVH
jgi:hypothetical protein